MVTIPHKYRCETCKKTHTKRCPRKYVGAHGNTDFFNGMDSQVTDCGCASHSDVVDVEKVIGELERRLKKESANYDPRYHLDEGRKSGYKEAIALLRGGVKKG